MNWPARPSLLPGIPAATYHADEFGDVPTLSRSVAHTLITYSPAHAYACHPRLGGNAVPKASKAMDLGSLVHALLLGGEEQIAVLPVDDYRTNKAKALRDEALSQGLVPIKQAEYQAAEEAASLISGHLTEGGIFRDSQGEVTALWEESTASFVIRCRARLDLWQADEATISDLKIVTSGPANPERFIRNMVYEGLDMQAAAYARAVEAVYPELAGRVKFRFLLCELEPPYDVVIVEPGRTMLALGTQRWERAVRLWARCIQGGLWPGRAGAAAVVAEAPEWALRDEFEKEVAGADA